MGGESGRDSVITSAAMTKSAISLDFFLLFYYYLFLFIILEFFYSSSQDHNGSLEDFPKIYSKLIPCKIYVSNEDGRVSQRVSVFANNKPNKSNKLTDFSAMIK